MRTYAGVLGTMTVAKYDLSEEVFEGVGHHLGIKDAQNDGHTTYYDVSHDYDYNALWDTHDHDDANGDDDDAGRQWSGQLLPSHCACSCSNSLKIRVV